MHLGGLDFKLLVYPFSGLKKKKMKNPEVKSLACIQLTVKVPYHNLMQALLFFSELVNVISCAGCW